MVLGCGKNNFIKGAQHQIAGGLEPGQWSPKDLLYASQEFGTRIEISRKTLDNWRFGYTVPESSSLQLKRLKEILFLNEYPEWTKYLDDQICRDERSRIENPLWREEREAELKKFAPGVGQKRFERFALKVHRISNIDIARIKGIDQPFDVEVRQEEDDILLEDKVAARHSNMFANFAGDAGSEIAHSQEARTDGDFSTAYVCLKRAEDHIGRLSETEVVRKDLTAAILLERCLTDLEAASWKVDARRAAPLEEQEFYNSQANDFYRSALMTADRAAELIVHADIDKIELLQSIQRRALHGLIFGSSDIASAKTVMGEFARFRLTPDAKAFTGALRVAKDHHEVIQELSDPKNSSMLDAIAFVVALRKVQDLVQAKEVLGLHWAAGVAPDIYFFGAMMSKAADLWEAREVHELLLEAGVAPNLIYFSAMLNKANDLQEAKEVQALLLDAGIAPNVFYFGAMMNKATDLQEAKEVHALLCDASVAPNLIYFSTMMNKVNDLQEAKEVQALLLDAGIAPDVAYFRAMMNKAADLREAKEVHELLIDAGIVPDVAYFRAMMNKAADLREAKEVHELLIDAGIVPDVAYFRTMMNKAADLREAKEVHELLIDGGVAPNVFFFGAMMNKAKDLQEAKVVQALFSNAGVAPNLIYFSTMMNKVNDLQEAKEVQALLSNAGVAPNLIYFSTMMNKANDLQEAKEIQALLLDAGIAPDVAYFGAMMNKAADLREAKEVHALLCDAGVAPNHICFRIMLTKAKSMPEAMEVLSLMASAEPRVRPTTEIMNDLIRKVPLQGEASFSTANRILEECKKLMTPVDSSTYQLVIKRARSREQADTLLSSMLADGQQPDKKTWDHLERFGIFETDVLRST
jgi:hypothetical protein